MPAALPALALSLLAAAPLPVKLASPGFKGVDVSEAQATFFSDHLAQQLTLRGLQVTTASQIGALLGFERQRQLLGCKEDSSSCMAELAAALGVDGVLTGSVGRFDQIFQVNVSVVSSRDGRTLSAFSRKVNGSSAVLDALNDAADQLARDLPGALGRTQPSKQIVKDPVAHQPFPRAPEPAPAATGGGLRDWFWLPGGAGVAAGAGAAAFLVLSSRNANQLQRAIDQPQQFPLSFDEAQRLRSDGRVYSGIGYALTAVGAIGLGAGAYFLLANPGAPQPVSLRLAPGPAGLALSFDLR